MSFGGWGIPAVGRAAEAYTVVAGGDQSQAQLHFARIPEVTTAHSGFADDCSCSRISEGTSICCRTV
jgi:hypothetical protein